METLLSVRNLRVNFRLDKETMFEAVKAISFDIPKNATVALVGESGSGKSVTSLSILGLLPKENSHVLEGSEIVYDGHNLVGLDQSDLRKLRGADISMIFQEPMTSLNPVLTIGAQISETVQLHQDLTKSAAWEKAVEMLRRVRIPEPAQRANEYPHQLSGGMRQRAMIAMALACNPKVLIADEPTTALDVTIQAQILDLMLALQQEFGTAIILITHDLAVVAETSQWVIVMYAGKKVEEADVDALFEQPLHPYTLGLLASIPRLTSMGGGPAGTGGRLKEIPGVVPPLYRLPGGCIFAPRCPFADDKCRAIYPPLEQKRPGHWAACWHSDRLIGAAS